MSSRQTAPERVGRQGRKRSEAARESRPRVEGDDESAAAAPALPGGPQVGRAARQVADEAKTVVGGEARSDHGRDRRRRARQHGQRQLGGRGRGDQTHAGVGDTRQPGVGDERHVTARTQQLEHVGGLLGFVVGEEARRGRVDVVAREQLAGAAGVFGGDQLDGAQRVEHARRNVVEVADGCGAHVEHGGIVS